jgi:2-methylcitrate dehydratase PrpD
MPARAASCFWFPVPVTLESGLGAVPVVGGGALSLGGAAFLNGVRSHALDFDDYEFAGSTHPSAPILAALLAVGFAEDMSVGDILRGWVVGYEVIVRLGEALGFGHYLAGWHSTSTLGPIAAAAACAHAMKLPSERIAAAMNMASSVSAGLQYQFGTDMKAAHVGLSARGGVFAAQYARIGAGAASDLVWSGPMGFIANFGTPASPGTNEILAKRIIGQGTIDHPVARKSWPSCSYTQRPIEAAITLREEHQIDSASISEVAIHSPAPYVRVVSIAEPTTSAEARFSVRYCVARALASGAVNPIDFETAALREPNIQNLMGKISIVPEAASDDIEDLSPLAPDRVVVTLRSGERLEKTIAFVRGGPSNPMLDVDLIQKAETCGAPARLSALLSPGDLSCSLVTSVFGDSRYADKPSPGLYTPSQDLT